VTVCVATMCRWNYGTIEQPNIGHAVVLATDRMITAGDVEYEPDQMKIASVAPNLIITVAGDYGYHSQAIKETLKQTDANSKPENVAAIYAQCLQAIKRKEAEDLYLAPLGLNTDTFLAQQKDMSDSFIASLREQLQGHRGEEAEAIVIGSDVVRERHISRLFAIDRHGIVRCYDDVGFAAIGSGASHALSRLMQVGYVNSFPYVVGLSAAFAAKKAAEIAPGVGKRTDLHVICRDNTEAVWPEVVAKLDSLHTKYEEDHLALLRQRVQDLDAYIAELAKTKASDAQGRKDYTTNAQTNGRSNPPAAETARKDEAGKT
jgi:20S proteasome alpha/beta subunit